MKKSIIPFIALLCIIPSHSMGQTDTTVACRADFDYYIDTRIMTFAPGMAVQFVDKSYGKVVAWSWNFGDNAGSTSDQQNPMHIFNYYSYNKPDSGVIDPMPPVKIPKVCLTIKTADSCTSTICKILEFKHDTILPPPPPVNGCDISFNAYRNDSIVSIPEVVVYSFVAKVPENTTKWKWNFGDGTTGYEANPVHSYPFRAADYYVCLSIETLDSCKSSYCKYVIEGPHDSTITPGCQALYTYQNLNSDPFHFVFTDQSAGNPHYWFWDFGDGSFSTLQNPDHIFRKDSIPNSAGIWYPNPYGTYKVCLTAVSSDSCKSTYCDYIHTIGVIDTGYTNYCGYLINLSTSNILGSGTCTGKASANLIDSIGNPVNAVKYYWSTGTNGETTGNLCTNQPYYVVITSENGCMVAGSFAIMDYTNPMNIFGSWTVNGSGSNYNFSYLLPGKDFTCTWEFSDSTVLEGDKVTHSFTGENNNLVKVIVRDASGNSVYTETIKLNENTTGIDHRPVIGMSLYPNPVKDELNIAINQTYTGKLSIEVYNTLGRLVMKQELSQPGSQNLRLNVSDLPPGIYIMSLSTNGSRIATAKFAK